MQKTQSPLLRLWQLGREHHGGLIAAIFCAVAGVLLGLLPYLSAGHILVALLTGVSMLRASGALDCLTALLSPLMNAAGIPPEIINEIASINI